MATLIESGRIFDDSEDSIQLAYREGPEDCLYAINIGEQLLLILVLHNGPYASRIGSVWFYAQRAAKDLRESFLQYEAADPGQIGLLGPDRIAAFANCVDDLSVEIRTLLLFTSEQSSPGGDQKSNGNKDGEQPDEQSEVEIVSGQPEREGAVMSFDEAMQSGILSAESFDDQESARQDN